MISNDDHITVGKGVLRNEYRLSNTQGIYLHIGESFTGNH